MAPWDYSSTITQKEKEPRECRVVVSRRESLNGLENDSKDKSHAFARTEAAIIISHAHAAVKNVTVGGVARHVVDLVPIASIAKAVDPPSSFALTLRRGLN